MKALVTGGGGFLGTRIVQMLHERGDSAVALGRHPYPHLEEAGIQTVQVDLLDAASVREACRDVDVVFHVAAIAAIWGRRQDFWDINVIGTRNVVDACLVGRVPRLVYTSSPSVVFGTEELCGIDESQPYPQRYLTHYPETKAVAERAVLEANGPDLATVALRPHAIWGPGDPHLIPRIIERARQGRLVQVGDGANLVDITYVDNAAEAHLLAADVLAVDSPCAGQAYFISQGEPVRLWPWLGEILKAVGAPPVTRRISFKAAYRIGVVMEAAYRAVGARSEPRMTRFLAAQLAKSHYFDISAARRDFGYSPRVSTADGLERMIASLGSG